MSKEGEEAPEEEEEPSAAEVPPVGAAAAAAERDGGRQVLGHESVEVVEMDCTGSEWQR